MTIPAGIQDGHAERIAGQGEPGEGGGPAGDLIVVLHVKEHEVFTRYGDDLLMQTRISFRQAVTGDEVQIPTITGEAELEALRDDHDALVKAGGRSAPHPAPARRSCGP